MNRSSAVRDAWHPQTREDRQAVLEELEQVLASAHFCNSRRYPALLRYIVENTLEGRSDQLKERTIGVEVFDRPASYDTNTDTVVRYTAGEVRKRLALYYHELDRRPAIQLALPPGSYIPEFVHQADGAGSDHPPEIGSLQSIVPVSTPDVDSSRLVHEPAGHGVADTDFAAAETAARTQRRRRSTAALFASVTLVAVVLLAASVLARRAPRDHTPLEDFWAPLLHDRQTVLLCTGGSVFKEGNFSGVITAGKDIEYPFVSSQTASAIARLSGLLERHGATADLQFSASTPVTTLREQPVILLGGYNNQWTLRLLDALPFHFTPEPEESIVSGSNQAPAHWVRDHSLPYSSAGDYALIARFRDSTTDSWIVVLAGLGRNGTEAAAQFVTSPHYMELLRNQLGADFANRNVEAILKVNVIEGKTGAPSLVAVRMW